jgi:NADH dehydrogenase/NADH:ubiquinone oxidoreductase subunit G
MESAAASGGGRGSRGTGDRGTVRGLIDGRPVEVPAGTTILEAARLFSIPIPTLCHHEGLPPEGGCRLCLVESRGSLVAACLFPLRAGGFGILTMSPEVRRARAFVISLLLARAPEAPRVLDLAAEYGVAPDPRLARLEPDGCLRCGRCVRACAAAGAEAIGLAGRGPARKVTGPFFEPPADCLGCLACARVCPTGVIRFEEARGRRRIWGRDFGLVPCPSCGRAWATEAELAFRGGFEGAVCPDCRRRAMAEALAAAPAIPGRRS